MSIVVIILQNNVWVRLLK